MKKFLLILFLCLLPSLCMGLSEEKKNSFMGEAKYVLYKMPAISYKWDTTGGVHLYDEYWGDCSSTIYQILRRIGWPVLRVEAIKMEAGAGNWRNRPVTLEEGEEGTLIFWTFTSDRKHGHVGFLMVSRKSGLLEVAHNSKSQGFHIEPLKNGLLSKVSSVKTLTYGEAEKLKLGVVIKQIQ